MINLKSINLTNLFILNMCACYVLYANNSCSCRITKKEVGNNIKISLDEENTYVNINGEIIPETIQKVKDKSNLKDIMEVRYLKDTDFYKINVDIFRYFTSISKIQYFNRKDKNNETYLLFAIETKKNDFYLGYYRTTKNNSFEYLFSSSKNISKIILLRKSTNVNEINLPY